MSYLRDGLPEEHRVLVMRPAEAPDPDPEELALIRRVLREPEVEQLRLEVEAAGTAGERTSRLARFNAVFHEKLRATEVR